MYRIIKAKKFSHLTQELARFQTDNEHLKEENSYLKVKLLKQSPPSLPKTGWSEIDNLFKKIDRLNKELELIRYEAHDILK